MLTVGVFIVCNWSVLHTIEHVCLQWESVSHKHLNKQSNCKQRSSTVSEKAPAVSKQASPIAMAVAIYNCNSDLLCMAGKIAPNAIFETFTLAESGFLSKDFSF